MSQPERGLRAGIAGFGLAGEVFHAPLIAAAPGLEVSAVVTGDPERGERARARYPGVVVAESVGELWGAIDLLVIAAPNRFHAELALEAIEHEVPVVIDKPIAPSVAEAERILAAGGRVTVFQNRRWDGDFLTVERTIGDGSIGDVFRFESRFERFRPEVGGGWRESADPVEGGGQLADLGPHLIDQAIQLFGPPETIYAEVDRRRPGVEADDDVFIALEHSGGAVSHLHMGKVAPLAGPRFRVSGTSGGLAIDGLDPQEGQLKAGLAPDDAGFGERPDGRLVAADGRTEDLPVIPGAYARFYAGVAEWLLEGSEPPVDPADSLRVMRVIEAARLSASDHRTVHFET